MAESVGELTREGDMSDNPNPVDWQILAVALGYVAAVAVFCTWAITAGRGDLAATSGGSILVTAGVLAYFAKRA